MRIYKTLKQVSEASMACVKEGGIGNNAQLGLLGFAPFNGSIEIRLLTDIETMHAIAPYLLQ